jgi:hypothetical protein
VNSSVANAVTAVQREQFIAGRQVGAQRVQVNDRELRQWRDDMRPGSIAPDRQSIVAGQPRRQAPPPAAFANDNPKRVSSGDFRASRVAAEQIKRAEGTRRDIAPENRIALREPSRNTQSAGGQSAERVQSMRGESRPQNDRPQNDSSRTRDRTDRPPVQALQGSPSESTNQSGSNAIRRSRESPDQRDVQHGDSRREVREQPSEAREQPRVIREQSREVREQPRARELSQPERQAPVERRAAPVERRAAPVEREQPRVERSQTESREIRSSPPPQRAPEVSAPRQNNNQNNNDGNKRNSNQSGDGPRSSRDRPNSRPD